MQDVRNEKDRHVRQAQPGQGGQKDQSGQKGHGGQKEQPGNPRPGQGDQTRR